MTRTNEAFTQLAGSTSRVGEQVGGIAAASGEQAQGIDQVNTAVSEMDKVTQSNAANAEETASASEELSAQAEQMQFIVAQLVELVRGRRKGTGMKSAATEVQTESPESKRLVPGRIKKIKPDDLIPMGDDDFKDF